MLGWLRTTRGSKHRSRRPAGADASSLLAELEGLLSAPHQATPALCRVRRFRELGPEEQARQLPPVYLLAEYYLVEVDSRAGATRDQLRDLVRSRYAPLLEDPAFGLIFEPPPLQEVLLCRHLLRLTLQRAIAVLGAGSNSRLISTLDWVSNVPHEAVAPVPLRPEAPLPQSEAGWVELLGDIAEPLYELLETLLGEGSAGRIYEGSFREAAEAYASLETFPVVVGLLPDKLFYEDELVLLSRNVRRVLVEKAERLQEANDQLAEQNTQLRDTQEELRAANEELRREIAARRQAEEEIQASLREKDVLLKEIHHRVKNNLQIICSLLNLQSDAITDAAVRPLFQESRNRVRSMALIHEKLYQSHDLARIDFAEYLSDLAASLMRSYSDAYNRVALELDVESAFLDIDLAVPCGLIVNELVTNSLKYAFPDGAHGTIRVGLHASADEGGALTLSVEDDGVGIPPELDLDETDSIGLQLVTGLIQQLEASYELRRDGGTGWNITFTDI